MSVLRCVIVYLIALASCSQQAATTQPVLGLQPTSSVTTSSCDPPPTNKPAELAVDPEADPVGAVLEAAKVAQERNELCYPESVVRVQCRALWLATVLDPVTLALDETQSAATRAEAALVLDWALAGAQQRTADQTASEAADLANAFAQLRPLSRDLSDQLTADVIIARTAPEIIDPLQAFAATGRCASE